MACQAVACCAAAGLLASQPLQRPRVLESSSVHSQLPTLALLRSTRAATSHRWQGLATSDRRQGVATSERRRGLAIQPRAEIGVQLGSSSVAHTKAAAGDRVRVIKSVKVYHVPKVAELELEGKEAMVKEVLGVWKGVEVSANLPYKAQFEVELNGTPTKFFAHLTDDEFEVL